MHSARLLGAAKHATMHQSIWHVAAKPLPTQKTTWLFSSLSLSSSSSSSSLLSSSSFSSFSFPSSPCGATHRSLISSSFSTRASSGESTSAGDPSSSRNQAAFGNLERLISDSLGGGPGGDWEEIEGCWVLHPPPESGPPLCSIHFIGGAFVGAAPQLSYSLLLESLAKRRALVIATPYPTSFDHVRTADDIYFKLSRCLKSLGPNAQSLPAYGLGHSLGALLQLLICSRYIVPRAGNVFMGM